MPSLKKQMKKIQKQQERLNEIIRLKQATCPHVSKKGKTRLVRFEEDGVEKGRCKKCGEVVILDKEFLSQDMLTSSAEVIKSALAEIRAAAHVGKIRLKDDTLQAISSFDAEVLRDLPTTLVQIASAGSEKKKKKKGKKKENKRMRWS